MGPAGRRKNSSPPAPPPASSLDIDPDPFFLLFSLIFNSGTGREPLWTFSFLHPRRHLVPSLLHIFFSEGFFLTTEQPGADYAVYPSLSCVVTVFALPGLPVWNFREDQF